jgi:hypothetical protein
MLVAEYQGLAIFKLLFIAIVFLVILIQSSTNMLIRQLVYGIHPISNPVNASSNQSMSGRTSWVDISQAIGGWATAGALIFVGFQTILTRKQTHTTQ